MLALLKEYIDAKADYDKYALGYQHGLLSPSVSLTEAGKQIRDRYLKAEANLNAAIEQETECANQTR